METKFIEGTNKQYSIREDGVIIRHYLKKGCGYNQTPWIEYKDVEMLYKKHPQRKCMSVIVRSNKKTYQFFKNSLLSKYFNIIICPQCENVINVSKHKRVCKTCIHKNVNDLQKKARRVNPLLYRSLQKNFYDNNREKMLIYHKEREKVNRIIITKNYVASKLEIPVVLLTDELYQNYKATLLVKRKLSKKLNTKPAYL
jgi:hypothetical protein